MKQIHCRKLIFLEQTVILRCSFLPVRAKPLFKIRRCIIMRLLRMNSKALLEPNVFLLAHFFIDTCLLKQQTPGIKQSVALDLKMKCKFGFLSLT